METYFCKFCGHPLVRMTGTEDTFLCPKCGTEMKIKYVWKKEKYGILKVE